MIERFLAQAGIRQAELAGTTVNAEIPLGTALINRTIAEYLARTPGKLSALVVEPQPDGVLLVHVRMRTTILPPLTMRLVIVEQPELPSSAVLVMRWSLEGGLGWLAKAASPALGLFQILPPGIRVDGDLLGIDIAELLRSKDLEWVVPLLRRLRVSTSTTGVAVQIAAGL
jgi:hypothetical protein